MPVKQKPTSKKHSKSFLRVYAPYLPLMLLVGLGLFISLSGSFTKKSHDEVLSRASGITVDSLVADTNKERSDSSIKPLAKNPQLTQAAQAKANDMVAKNYWSHTTPDGKEPWYFIEQTGYTYSKSAENLAYGFTNSKATVSGWMNSPPHRANILDTDLTEVGFGIANAENYQGKGPQTVVVAMYGKSADVQTLPINQTLSNDQTRISHIQTITDGKAPWSSFAFGLLIGSIAVYLLVTHARGIRRILRISERFIVKHPLVDMTLLALLALAAILIQTAGTIY